MTTRKRIILTFLGNNYKEAVRNKFFNWLYASHYIEEKESILKSFWDEMNAPSDDSTLRSLYQVEIKLGFHTKEKSTRYTLFKKLSRIAAVFILPLLSALITYLFTGKEQMHGAVEFAECFVPYGEIKTVLLPDSTLVTVNSGSTLIYPVRYQGSERYVYLNGEAYFDVKPRSEAPFLVKIDSYDVEVLGTKFNVSSYSDAPDATTTLRTGKVRVNFKHKDAESIIIMPSEQISYNKQTKVITRTKRIPEESIAAWMHGHFIFQRASIHDILKTFERRYGITVYLNSNHFEEDAITVKFIYGETLEESFQILKQITPNLQYKIQGDKVYVY